ncbi:long-chain fatty acid--CoA ligase [uncultured Photobacterium sp.]|uniref:long-chain-fatty-acid--CoA ligase n=1 Tax=uncultured Photobacterium sp. TaxID=173973 RepID=UPI002616EE41|nr:long-chain fatty acid--CoA ligase [uncultured Photobacterium sp.]
MMNLAAALQRNAKCKPNKVALICGDVQFTYAEFDHIASQVAGALIASGIQPGDRVALSCPNIPFFPFIYYGIQKAGGVVVPLNVLFKEREIKYHLEDSGAKFFFCFEGTAELPMAEAGIAAFEQVEQCEHMAVITRDPKLLAFNGMPTLSALIHSAEPVQDYVARQADDTAVVLYTSGTTGEPKGAMLTQGNMVCNAMVASNLMAGNGNDVHLAVLPLFHSFGQTVHMNTAILSGATLLLIPRFEPQQVLGEIEKHHATIFAGVPTMYIGLLQAKAKAASSGEQSYDISSLRLAISGGAPLPAEVIHSFESQFNIPILEGYGLSETSPVACFHHLDAERVTGSVGQPVQGVEIRVVDEKGEPVEIGRDGEVIIRGHNVMKGYLNRPEETALALKDGWLHTGDIGQFDQAGNLYVVDRIKDMVIRAGFNVYPREIEDVLMTHPGVAMAAVIGIPDSKVGEEIKAYVVLKESSDGAAQPDEQCLIEWSKTQLASYKYPRHIEFRQHLPISATGKILKRELKAELV